MLELNKIIKEYELGGQKYSALKSVSVAFPSSEFVSILGASGSGKTTMLNIIGGIDNYTSGDLLLGGKSTKDFKDKDWDSYRNGTIGFIFQSYNLISHLSVIDNVKLALSISGISSSKATQKAKEVLGRVGLAEHINKKPTQLSGGQMQRVAIARALATDPKVILADEPTGALDSKTSVQIMELIKEISKDKLVIMVTHNPELAEQYSDRIIRLADGQIVEDTKPYTEKNVNDKDSKLSKIAMAFKDALKSSFKNLMTKKVRTILTILAGSIGIVSIALILSISSGMNSYIDKIERDNVTSMPLSISENQSNDMLGVGVSAEVTEVVEEGSKKITANNTFGIHKNIYAEDVLGNGQTFIKYLTDNAKDYYKNIEFTSSYSVKTLVKNYKNNYQEVKGEDEYSNPSIFTRLSEDSSVITSQYDIVEKLDSNFSYATNANELILFVDKNNGIDKTILKALGLDENTKLEFKDILGKEISFVDNNNYFEEKNGLFTPKKADEGLYNTGTKAKIVAIAKPNKDNISSPSYAIGYTAALEKLLLEKEKNSKIVVEQSKDKSKDVTTKADISGEQAEIILGALGASDKPSSISIYPKSLEDKEKIVNVIEEYNKKVKEKFSNDSDKAKYEIKYMDLSKSLTSLVGETISVITIILTAFSAISLIVSSVMIGILTYVSVVERTKEIGILRAIGARKKDITRIFNAEAGIVGFISGLVGVLIAVAISAPLSSIIKSSINVDSFNASLPLNQAVYLIGLSLILTLIASIIPARIAAKKKPVEALRSE